MDLKNIPFGEPEAFNVIIEIPEGSNQKFEYDEASGEMRVNFVFKDLVFPFNYGFIANTLGGDGDALDAIVLSSAPLESGEVLKCKAVGVLKTLDRGEVDDKIICVSLSDKLSEKYQDIPDLPPDSLQKWTDFYMEVARQKEKTVEILDLKNKQEALVEIKKSIKKTSIAG
jgi:inorganic pyrophosphatase